MSKSSTDLPLKVVLTVPSAKEAEHVVSTETVDLTPLKINIEASLESIYQNQINQSNQPVNDRAPRKQK